MGEALIEIIDDVSKRPRLRAPNYPVVGLPTAIQSAAKVHQQEGNVPVPMEGLLRDLGFDGPTALALRTVAALKTYGLLVEEAGDYRLTDDALSVISLAEGDPEYKAAIARLSEKPEIFQQLKKKYPEGLPSDRTIRIVLVKEWGFSDAAADGVLAAFRQTSAFAAQVTGAPDTSAGAAGPLPVRVVTPRPPPTGLVHVWSLGAGVSVELRSSAPLSREHFDLLTEYVKLARRAAAERTETGQHSA